VSSMFTIAGFGLLIGSIFRRRVAFHRSYKRVIDDLRGSIFPKVVAFAYGTHGTVLFGFYQELLVSEDPSQYFLNPSTCILYQSGMSVFKFQRDLEAKCPNCRCVILHYCTPHFDHLCRLNESRSFQRVQMMSDCRYGFLVPGISKYSG